MLTFPRSNDRHINDEMELDLSLSSFANLVFSFPFSILFSFSTWVLRMNTESNGFCIRNILVSSLRDSLFLLDNHFPFYYFIAFVCMKYKQLQSMPFCFSFRKQWKFKQLGNYMRLHI